MTSFSPTRALRQSVVPPCTDTGGAPVREGHAGSTSGGEEGGGSCSQGYCDRGTCRGERGCKCATRTEEDEVTEGVCGLLRPTWDYGNRAAQIKTGASVRRRSRRRRHRRHRGGRFQLPECGSSQNISDLRLDPIRTRESICREPGIASGWGAAIMWMAQASGRSRRQREPRVCSGWYPCGVKGTAGAGG